MRHVYHPQVVDALQLNVPLPVSVQRSFDGSDPAVQKSCSLLHDARQKPSAPHTAGVSTHVVSDGIVSVLPCACSSAAVRKRQRFTVPQSESVLQPGTQTPNGGFATLPPGVNGAHPPPHVQLRPVPHVVDAAHALRQVP
jgi:hypothetical protein